MGLWDTIGILRRSTREDLPSSLNVSSLPLPSSFGSKGRELPEYHESEGVDPSHLGATPPTTQLFAAPFMLAMLPVSLAIRTASYQENAQGSLPT
jgi:hypothetical protein